MGWIARNVLNLLGLPGDLQTFWISLGVSALWGTVIGALEYWHGSGQLAWAAVAATGAFGLSVWAIVGLLKLVQKISVFRMITVRRFEPMDGEIQTQTKTLYVTVGCVLENNSNRPLFYRVVRADLSIQGRINQDAKLDGLVAEIPQKSHRYLRLPTISGIDATKRAEGKVELQIEYGATAKRLRYRFDYEGAPSLIHRWDGVRIDGDLAVKILSSITKSEHHRKWLI